MRRGTENQWEAGFWHMEKEQLTPRAGTQDGGAAKEKSALPELKRVDTDEQQARAEECEAHKSELPAEEDSADPAAPLLAEPSAWTIPLLQPFIDSTVDSAVRSVDSTVSGTPPFICARAGCLRGQEHTKICQAISTIVLRTGWDTTYGDICLLDTDSSSNFCR